MAGHMTDPSHDLSWLTERSIAHRGLHGALLTPIGRTETGAAENSMGAFIAASDRGFWIECDVQSSADGEAMVFHDTTLDRTTHSSGPIGERTLAQLREVRLRGPVHRDSRVKGGIFDTIPTLAEVRSMVRERIGLVIEIKGDGADPVGLTERVIEITRNWDTRHVLMSFDHRVLTTCFDAGVPCGLTAMGRAGRDFNEHARVADRAAFLSYCVDDLPNPFVKEFRGSKRPVITWTVRTADQARASRAHADAMTFEGFDPRYLERSFPEAEEVDEWTAEWTAAVFATLSRDLSQV